MVVIGKGQTESPQRRTKFLTDHLAKSIGRRICIINIKLIVKCIGHHEIQIAIVVYIPPCRSKRRTVCSLRVGHQDVSGLFCKCSIAVILVQNVSCALGSYKEIKKFIIVIISPGGAKAF